MNEKSHYLYARELAELYDISKQTLIFYDKINLLKPAFVGSLRRCFVLRKLHPAAAS